MLADNLFSGVVDFTDGSLSSLVGITGSATYGSSVITGVDSTIVPGLTSGLSVRALPEGIINPSTTIVSLGSGTIELSDPVGYTGSANFYIGLSSGNYLLNNALFVDVNNIYNVGDIPDYQIGASGGLGISPFAIYAQGRYNDQKNLKAIYEKYIITKVLSRNTVTNRFSAIVTWGFTEPAPSSVNTGQTVLPIVQLSPLNLLPPIIDYRAFTYKNLPEGQPFNQEILNVLDFGGSGGGSPLGVYGTGGNLLTAGATGIQFLGVGVSSGASGDYVTVEIGQYTYPTDLTVSIQPGKTFGRYENGDTIPAAGKTPAEVIVLAINEAINPTVNLNATPATIPFYTATQNIAVSFSYVINTLGGTVASVLLRRRRGTGSWTTLTTDVNLTSYTDTITNSPPSDTTNIQYEYTVTDDQGATATATDTVNYIPYVSPSISISVTAANTPLASPETNSTREIGNISSNITGTITANSTNATLQSYQIQYQLNGTGSFTTIASGAITSSPFTVPSFNHNDVALVGSTSLTYNIVVTDVYTTNTSANSTVSFYYLIFNGPSASVPSTSANVRALSRVFVTSPPFNLLTGTTYNNFTVAMPATKTLLQVLDLDALSANITANYVAGLSTFNVNDYAGNPVSYKVYTMTNAIPYSDGSHRHNITFN